VANNIVLFNTGRVWLAKQLVTGGNTILDGEVTFRFFVNDVTLNPSGPSSAFIALYMAGYSPFVLAEAVAEGIDANGNATWIWPVTTITCNASSGGPWIAYGYWVTANNDETVLWGQLFDVPPVWMNFGDYATVAPQFSLGTLDLGATPVLTPVVLSVAPSSGLAESETPVLIEGSYLTGATAVTFGGTEAATFEVVNDNTIMATSPALPAGTVDVQVTTGVGTSTAWVYDQFTYT
jgi:hypothetical protein